MKKIPTLFTRVFKDHKIIDIKPEITEGCEEAFLNGIATVKLDGSCCMILNNELYKRYDAKWGKPIPKDAIKCQNKPDPVTGHFPCWIKCDRNNSADKWFWNAFDNTSILTELTNGTYEAIGKHFQSNPYNLQNDYLCKHGGTIINVERTFEGIRNYLMNNYEEGIVFWYNNEPVCKIKRSDFGFKWNNH